MHLKRKISVRIRILRMGLLNFVRSGFTLRLSDPDLAFVMKKINVVQFFPLDKLVSNSPKMLIIYRIKVFRAWGRFVYVPFQIFLLLFLLRNFQIWTVSTYRQMVTLKKFLHLTSRELGLLRRDGRWLFLYRGVQPEQKHNWFFYQSKGRGLNLCTMLHNFKCKNNI